MRETDQALLDGINEMIEQAPGVGLCSFPFKILRDEVERIIGENETMRKELDSLERRQ